MPARHSGLFWEQLNTVGRRISIYPLHTEHQRTAAFIGCLLNHEHYLGPIYNGILSFSTRNMSSATTCSFALIAICLCHAF